MSLKDPWTSLELIKRSDYKKKIYELLVLEKLIQELYIQLLQIIKTRPCLFVRILPMNKDNMFEVEGED